MRRLRAAMRGAVEGAVATVAMSVPMMVADRLGLMGSQPPEHVSRRLLGAVGARPETPRQQTVAAAGAHLGFGAGVGAAWTGTRPDLGPGPATTLEAVAVALSVWALSYQGWVPALGILPPASRDQPGRQWTMVAAHVVYGVVLGAMERRHASA